MTSQAASTRGSGPPAAGRASEAGSDPAGLAAYVERFGHVLTEAGMPRLASRVFARLLADDDGRMTAAELTHALDVSPAAVSGAVRHLTQVALIGRERERGSRRDVYVVHLDAWHDAMMRRDRVLGQLEVALRTGVDAVGGQHSPAGRRLQLTIEFLAFVAEQLALTNERWEVRKAQLLADWSRDDEAGGG